MKPHLKIARYIQEGKMPDTVGQTLAGFFQEYTRALTKQHVDEKTIDAILSQYLELVLKQVTTPFFFETFHQKITEPYNYFAFGLFLMRPLIQMAKSQVLGLDHVKLMVQQLKKGENVILFANHQIEPDPQVINILLENSYPEFASDMIFVAGDRVITDPLAVPLSMGCNLLCIYSKRRIDNPPELKIEKQSHNQRTMKRMSELLAEGGKAIYVAPSGGRDRKDAAGNVPVSPFDAQSIEMFWLMSQRSGKTAHFYPLALSTYDLMPPPQNFTSDAVESRPTSSSPAHLAFGAEIDMEHFPGSDNPDKKLRRQLRCDYIWGLVHQDYERITQPSNKKPHDL